jgi:nitrite reductase/ring-hydroxylating ferredoxin subunit
MRSFVKVVAKTELAEGQGRALEVQGKAIALFNVGGTFYAIDNTCKHRGGPLGDGDLEGNTVTCPWHGWQYDVTTGACQGNPAVSQTNHVPQNVCKTRSSDFGGSMYSAFSG